ATILSRASGLLSNLAQHQAKGLVGSAAFINAPSSRFAHKWPPTAGIRRSNFPARLRGCARFLPARADRAKRPQLDAEAVAGLGPQNATAQCGQSGTCCQAAFQNSATSTTRSS